MWKVVTSSNLNSPLKLFFYLPILINNNLLLKIYCENIVKILWQYFLMRIFFLYYFSSNHFIFIHVSFHFFFFFVFLLHTSVQPPSFYFLFHLIKNIPTSLLHIKEKRERGEIGLSSFSRSSRCFSAAPASPPPLGQIGLFFLFFFFFFIYACSDSTLF